MPEDGVPRGEVNAVAEIVDERKTMAAVDAASVLGRLRAAFEQASDEAELLDAVAAARDGGETWKAIGEEIGETAEGARKRFGAKIARRQATAIRPTPFGCGG